MRKRKKKEEKFGGWEIDDKFFLFLCDNILLNFFCSLFLTLAEKFERKFFGVPELREQFHELELLIDTNIHTHKKKKKRISKNQIKLYLAN